MPRHLRTGIHKWSDDSAKNAVNHFGIRKKKIKDGNKYQRKPKKCCYCSAVVQRLSSHILKKHPEHHPQKNQKSSKKEYYQTLKDAEVHDLSKYVFSSDVSPKRQSTIKNDAILAELPERIMKMHQSAQNTVGNNLMFSELPERVVKTHQSAFINNPIFSRSSPKESTKMHQSTIRIDPMFSESPVGIMKTHQNPIRFPSYDESPTDYLVSNSDESFESDDPLDDTYLPDPVAISSDRKLFQNVVSQISDELKVIYKSFLDYLKGPDSAQGDADNICSEVKRIDVVIGAQELKDLLDSSKIRDQYLTYCSEKQHKPDSIRKYLRSLNRFYTFLVIRRKELSMDYISNEELILLQQKITNWSGQYNKKEGKGTGTGRWRITRF